MKICFPVESNEGLGSKVFGHFGSAPHFVVVETETKLAKTVSNSDLGHAHGACRPMRALGGEAVDAIVVGGIGAGALAGLQRAGLKVFRARKGTVGENLDALLGGSLQEVDPAQVCGGHAHGGGCGH